MWHLDRCELSDGNERLRLFCLFIHENNAAVSRFGIVFQLDNTPNAPAEESIIFFRVKLINRNALDSQIGKLSFILVKTQIQGHCYLINDSIRTALPKPRQYFLRLIRTHEIIRKDLFYTVYTLRNNLFIVRAAILPKKKLQHIDRYIRTLFDLFSKVFPHDPAVKILAQLYLFLFLQAHFLSDDIHIITSSFGFLSRIIYIGFQHEVVFFHLLHYIFTSSKRLFSQVQGCFV